MITLENFVEYCKNYIIDHIDEFVGNEVYACDLAYELTQGPNCDGTLTYDTEKAKDYLKEWWYDCSLYWEYEKGSFGESMHNPFENPEAYMVCMVVEGVNNLLAKCPVIEKKWNDKFTLTKRQASAIKKFVKDFNEDEELF